MSDAPPSMASPKSYLVRAFYDWILDHQLTPYMAIDATMSGVILPPSLRQRHEVIFNVSSQAAIGLALGRTRIEFRARIGGALAQVAFPVEAVLGVYALENSEGVMFLEDGSMSVVWSGAWDDTADNLLPAHGAASEGGAQLKVVAINPDKAQSKDDNH